MSVILSTPQLDPGPLARFAGRILSCFKLTFCLLGDHVFGFGNSFKCRLELQLFDKIDADDPLAALEQDDHLLVEMAYFS